MAFLLRLPRARSYVGFMHFSCRTGKSRVLRILSPHELRMENGFQYAERIVPGFLSVFSTQPPARGRKNRNRPKQVIPATIFDNPHPSAKRAHGHRLYVRYDERK